MLRAAPLLPLVAIALVSACQPTPDQRLPAWCEATGDLSLTCSTDDCVVGVIVDYRRLEPRGYRVFSLVGNAVTRKTVEERCTRHVIEVLGAPKPDQVDSDEAGDFFNCFLSYADADNWLVTVHARTGQVVFAGLEVWANPVRDKDPKIPPGWSGPTALGCEAGVENPVAPVTLRTTGMPMASSPASTAAGAWEVVRKLNLTRRFTAGRGYRVMVVSYSEATGEFDPGAADWYVYLSLQPTSDPSDGGSPTP
jgi:hypothetical protein